MPDWSKLVDNNSLLEKQLKIQLDSTKIITMLAQASKMLPLLLNSS